MAHPEHLQILQQGVEAWNQWLHRGRGITPDLSGANLMGADLRQATLRGADLSETHLRGADLRQAYLRGADVSKVWLSNTVFGNTILTDVVGLETCMHNGPSTLDHRTLAHSWPLPLAFHRGCGLNDWEIEVTKLYAPGLTAGQVTDILYGIYPLRTDPLIQFYSCFICYASKDHTFAERLYADLQNNGVRCWFAPEDLPIGAKIRVSIDESIRVCDKLLLILSKASVTSPWVEQEVETALARERQQANIIF